MANADITCTPEKHIWRSRSDESVGNFGVCKCGAIRRCSAHFVKGGQCRRREVEGLTFADEGYGYCKKHAWVDRKVRAVNNAALDALERHANQRDDDDEG